MGKGAIDLPDPLEHANTADAPSPAGAGGVDDLLAQMAGEEIDRLLADADATRDPPPSPSPEKSADRSADRTAAQPSAPPAKPVPAAPSPAVRSPRTDAAAPPPATGVDLDLATSLEERSALELPAADPAPANAAAAVVDASVFDELAAEVPEGANDRSLPAYLKPLEWLNAPLAALPEGIRELIGKIALLTLFNAVAVLIYVLIFRHKGH